MARNRHRKLWDAGNDEDERVNHDWWWHVFHDPMIENPWGFIAGMLSFAIPVGIMVTIESWRSRRIKKRWKQQ